MLARIRRRKLPALVLDVVFVAWVLYVTATGRLLPPELTVSGGGTHHAPAITQPVQSPAGDPVIVPAVLPDLGDS